MMRLLILATGLVLLVLAPFIVSSSYAIVLMCQIGIAAVFALSYNLLMGETGMLSFGHAAYYGAGAFATIHLIGAVNAGGLDIPIALLPLGGGIAALALGLVTGVLITRTSGIAFAMITLGIGEVMIAAAQMFSGLFGGESGISANRARGPELFGLTFGPQHQLYWLVLAWVLVSVALMYGLTRTPLGRIANAVRDNAERVSYLRYDPRLVRLLMFAGASFFAGVAGGLAAIVFEIVTVEALSLNTSSIVVLMTFIGGTGHFLGPVLGAAVVSWLQSSLSSYSDAWVFYLGLFFMLMMIFAPEGLAGLISKFLRLASAEQRLANLKHVLAMAVGLLPLLLGSVLAIELTYRLSPVSTRGRTLDLAGTPVDAASPFAWGLAIVLLALGTLAVTRLFRRPDAASAVASPEPQE